MVGKILRSLRKSHKLTQKEVAPAAGIARNRVIEIEKDEFPYSIDKLNRYVAAIGYDLELHFVDKGDKSNVLVHKMGK